MKKSRFLALLISLGMVSSPALAAKKFLNNDLNMSNRFKKQEPESGAEQFREDTGINPVVACLLYAQGIRELIGYVSGYKISIDKANVGYAVKKICEYNSKEARKERLRRKLWDIIEKSGLNRKLGKEGRVGKLLRLRMANQNFVDVFNSLIENKFDYKLAIPKILNEKVVDEMLAVTTMSDKEKIFVKTNVDFYLCPVRSFDSWEFEIHGFLKSYDFLGSYKKNPLVIQDRSASTPDELVREADSNEVAFVYFSSGQLMNGDHFTEEYQIKPLNILKKVNGKLVLEDENEYEMVKEFFENVDSGAFDEDDFKIDKSNIVLELHKDDK